MRKSVAFYLKDINVRGTTTAIFDYAKYNETLLNNKSIIIYNVNSLIECKDENFIKRHDVVKMFKDNFETVAYTTNQQLSSELIKRDCEYVYVLKGGAKDEDYFPGFKNLIHCVFNFYDPHGHRYAYISNWLTNVASGGKYPFVPHVVSLPKAEGTYRQRLNIPDDKIVIGRIGGYDQFSFDWIQHTVNYIAQLDDSFVFLFVNTRKFMDHPNVIFLDSIIDPKDKFDFYTSCDATLHGRLDGESFGLVVCESLFCNVPVFSCGLGRDKHNVELLEKHGMIFNNQYELLELFFKLKHNILNRNVSHIVEQFSPEKVMEKFDEVFLR